MDVAAMREPFRRTRHGAVFGHGTRADAASVKVLVLIPRLAVRPAIVGSGFLKDNFEVFDAGVASAGQGATTENTGSI